ncbi:MAG: CDP-diacylglycerol--glycerol-3-phosphate 3-phosphatidyltransferase [Johnsonella sp.]|nr:CDP-diacylglycerol--glycerol-3-phosphate 3-phosphatidyltransferase [Johnsonella sp.]
MNLPNKLTVLRVLMIPFFVFFLLYGKGELPSYRLIAFVIFTVAALTDTLDGILARKYNLITNFGKFMDPLADKLLVVSALICFIELDQISSLIVIAVIAREFIISGFRLVASDAGIVIAASKWGKLKTVAQMIAVELLILNIQSLRLLSDIMVWTMLALTLISLMDYIVKNKNVISGGSVKN